MFSKYGRGGRREDAGGCIKQRVVDALWELASRFEVGLWTSAGLFLKHTCYVVVNEVGLYQLNCFISRRVLTRDTSS